MHLIMATFLKTALRMEFFCPSPVSTTNFVTRHTLRWSTGIHRGWAYKAMYAEEIAFSVGCSRGQVKERINKVRRITKSIPSACRDITASRAGSGVDFGEENAVADKKNSGQQSYTSLFTRGPALGLSLPSNSEGGKQT